jgi:hypothetical protein
VVVLIALGYGFLRAVIAILLIEDRSKKWTAMIGLIPAIPAAFYFLLVLVYTLGGGH